MSNNIPYERSFASHPKAIYWSDKNGDIKPKDVFKSANKKYWFDCNICGHSFDSSPNKINGYDRWCPYCSNSKLCQDLNCNKCNINSFASHPKAIYWSDKNGDIKPRGVFKSSNKKYWFDCNICGHTINILLSGVSSGSWCSYCSAPTKQLCDDNNCNFCFNNSFASHPKAEYWSNKNGDITPRQVLKGSGKIYWFNCNLCNHNFQISVSNITSTNSSWCQYCCIPTKMICDNSDCMICYNNSLASHPKSIYWSDKNGEVKPRQILKGSQQKYWFDCNICNHTFQIQTNVVVRGGWCGFCAKRYLCDDNNCESCFNRSFASHPKSQYWSKKNGNTQPRSVSITNGNKYWFDCNNCDNCFQMAIHHITNRNSWCGICKNEGEKIMYSYLIKVYPTLIFQFRKEWCKRNGNNFFYDFCIPEYDIIIELDGRQHYMKSKSWRRPTSEIQEIDIYKEECANDNGYSTIRIIEEDVRNNNYDWKKKLKNEIEYINNNRDVIHNIYICNNDEYSYF